MALRTLELSRIDLGRDEAEQDSGLMQYFVRTGNFERVVSEQKYLVIGRKGTGKSAIYKKVAEEFVDRGYVVRKLDHEFVKWANENAETMREQSAQWKLVVYSQAFVALDEAGHCTTSLTRALAVRARELLGLKPPRLLGLDTSKAIGGGALRIRELAMRIKAFSSPWGGLTLGEADSVWLGRAVSEFEAALDTAWPASVKGVRICIDRLDEYWDGSERARRAISGLIQAVHLVNGMHSGFVRTTLFLRSDIYDVLRWNDEDHVRQDIVRLSWDPSDLEEMLAERIRWSLNAHSLNTSEIWAALFAPTGYDHGVAPNKYVVGRTFKRPRDVIALVRASLERAIDAGHEQILSEDVDHAEANGYSADKCKDIVIEYGDVQPWIGDALDFLARVDHVLPRSQLETKLRKFLKGQNAHEQLTVRQIIELLYSASALGLRSGRTQPTTYSYDPGTARPDDFEWFAVHPALWRHMSIKERRARAGAKPREVAESPSPS